MFILETIIIKKLLRAQYTYACILSCDCFARNVVVTKNGEHICQQYSNAPLKYGKYGDLKHTFIYMRKKGNNAM